MENASSALWKDVPFVIFFIGNVVSFTGMQITRIVLPILIYQLTGSALQTTLLITVQTVPNFVFGLFAGAIADRVDRRLLMVSFNIVNALVLASIPVLYAWGALTIERLYLAAFLSAAAYVFSEAADFGALPAIVGRDQVVPEPGRSRGPGETGPAVFHPPMITAIIRQLVRSLEVTTVVVLDDVNFAARHCDRLVLLVNGAVRCRPTDAGTPERPTDCSPRMSMTSRYDRQLGQSGHGGLAIAFKWQLVYIHIGDSCHSTY